METLAEIYKRHASPNPGGPGWGDKGTVHSYIDVYAELLEPYRHMGGNVLEIGLMNGSSLRMWEEYFYRASVWGVDLCDQPLGMVDLRPMIAEGGHNIVLCDACDRAAMQRHFGAMQFVVIIEDAGHNIESQLQIYRNLRGNLRWGGIYIIEDVADVDKTRDTLLGIDPERQIEIIDRRNIKGRFDDVLVVVRSWAGRALTETTSE